MGRGNGVRLLESLVKQCGASRFFGYSCNTLTKRCYQQNNTGNECIEGRGEPASWFYGWP